MTDFNKHDPEDPNKPPQGGDGQQPPGGFPPPSGGYGQPPQGGYSPTQGDYGQPPQGGYAPPGGFPPPPQGNYGQPATPGGYPPPPSAQTGGAPAGYYFDQLSGLTLPNGTELAGRGRRIGAFFLAIPLIFVTLIIGYLVWGLVLWGRGTSPALHLLGMKCYQPATGQVATFGTMALRDIVGSIVQGILSVLTGLISFILFLATGKRQSLPDLIGGTVVLYDPNKVLG